MIQFSAELSHVNFFVNSISLELRFFLISDSVEIFKIAFDNWDIYEWEYEWMYCIWCEAFKKDDDLIERDWKKVCPDHLKEPDKIKEKNYFFKLSKYENDLIEFYEKNPNFVIPSDRFNEVKAFVKRWLEDFSVSRETNKFGVKLPFDEEQVTYVWYDALFNYITVCQWGNENFWPADLHVVGKDIIRFHAIYWPAMLMSAWYELPKQILTTWFFTVDWHKISKSLWNVIDPVEFSEKYSKEIFEMVENYLSDAKHFESKDDFVNAFAALNYAHGWLDSGVRLDIFKVKDDKLFTIKWKNQH